MNLAEVLVEVLDGRSEASFDLFSQTLDHRWIEEALTKTGTATIRRRRLPAEYVVWIVIGMGLFRDRSIEEVVRHLDLALPADHAPPRGPAVTGGAIVQARDRLGDQPLEALFRMTADRWALDSVKKHPWRELLVYGVDGSTLRVADSPENEEAFGRPRSGRGKAGYPQARIVALMALRSHVLADLVLGRFDESEVTLAGSLWARLPDSSLTILDRGFLSYELFHQIESQGSNRHWLTRAKKNLTWNVVSELGANDRLVDLPVSRAVRNNNPEMPKVIRARVINYQRPGFSPQMLLTSLLDPVAYPAEEIIALYHERWEIELGFDEVKTHTLERIEALRSRAPERVRQEIWGLAIAYNLVRLEMERVAEAAGVPPNRISYRHSLMLIRNFWITASIASPGILPKRLQALERELALLILPERRSRGFPRVVKIKMSNYPRKRI